MRLILFFLSTLSIVALSCKNGAQGPVEKTIKPADLPADFQAFYQRFHADSAYQMSHIDWPLKGERPNPSENGGSKKMLTAWEPEDWSLFSAPDLADVGLKRTIETMGDALIIERLEYPMVNYGLERQFFKDDNQEWHLIYYAEMQELR